MLVYHKRAITYWIRVGYPPLRDGRTNSIRLMYDWHDERACVREVNILFVSCDVWKGRPREACQAWRGKRRDNAHTMVDSNLVFL